MRRPRAALFRVVARRGTVGFAAATALLAGAGAAAGGYAPPLAGSPVLGQMSQQQCSLPGLQAQALLFDSAAHIRAWGVLALPDGGQPLHWSRERLLVVALNQQPTLGIALAAEDAPQAPATLTLRVQRPGLGQMAQQALSRPCVWVRLPRRAGPVWQLTLHDPAQTGPVQQQVGLAPARPR